LSSRRIANFRAPVGFEIPIHLSVYEKLIYLSKNDE